MNSRGERVHSKPKYPLKFEPPPSTSPPMRATAASSTCPRSSPFPPSSPFHPTLYLHRGGRFLIVRSCSRVCVCRLVYRSKQRGFLELDLVLGSWVEQHIHSMDEANIRAVLQVLDLLKSNCCLVSGAPWYIISNVQENMTGKGSLKKEGFCVLDISFVPVLNKNITSISQLHDSGLVVEFSINGCIIRRTCDSMAVCSATYEGDQTLYRLRLLEVDLV